MPPDTFIRLRQGDTATNSAYGKDVFTVVGSYSDGSRIVFARHVQLPGDDITEWSYADSNSITSIESLKIGDEVRHNSSNTTYVIVTTINDHAYGACLLEVRTADAEQWSLVAKSQLKIA